MYVCLSGKGVGSLLGGQLCEVYGLRTTFRAYGVSSFFVLIVYVAVEMKAGRMGRGSARQSQQPDGEGGGNTWNSRVTVKIYVIFDVCDVQQWFIVMIIYNIAEKNTYGSILFNAGH